MPAKRLINRIYQGAKQKKFWPKVKQKKYCHYVYIISFEPLIK